MNQQAFPGTDDMRTPEQVSDYIKAQNAKWPAGYCLDPNGHMVCPEGQREAWAFGYDIGYQDAFKTLKSAQLKVMIEADAVELESSLRSFLEVFDSDDTDIRLGAVANAKAVLAQLDAPRPAQAVPLTELFSIDEIAQTIDELNALLVEHFGEHAAPAPAQAVNPLDALLTQILNRRVTVEQQLFDMAAGKLPMPDKDKLRELAMYLGDPASQPTAPAPAQG